MAYLNIRDFDPIKSKPALLPRDFIEVRTVFSTTQELPTFLDSVCTYLGKYKVKIQGEFTIKEGVALLTDIANVLETPDWFSCRFYEEELPLVKPHLKRIYAKHTQGNYSAICTSYEKLTTTYAEDTVQYYQRKERKRLYEKVLATYKKPTIRKRLDKNERVAIRNHLRSLPLPDTTYFRNEVYDFCTHRTSYTVYWGVTAVDIISYGLYDKAWFDKLYELGAWVDKEGAIGFERSLTWEYFFHRYQQGWINKYPKNVLTVCAKYKDTGEQHVPFCLPLSDLDRSQNILRALKVRGSVKESEIIYV